jgi:DNA replication protein DnaC
MDSTIDTIAARSASAIRITDGDFVQNGIVFCGKCRTPKQTEVEVCGQTRKVMCLCRCETERRDAEEAAQKRRERLIAIDSMRVSGFPDAEMTRWTFENDDGANDRISRICRNYAENFETMLAEGKGLLLFGAVGTGKTFGAACIANALIDKGYPCLVTNFARLVNSIGGMFEGRQDYIDSLDRFDLLVIDDLAAERDTEYMGEIVQNIIDARYRAKKPLIVTTNLTADELKRPADMRRQRVFSRLFEMCIPIEVQGADRRKARLREDMKKYDTILGL